MIGGIIFGLYYNKIISFIFHLTKRRNPSTNSMTKEQENVQKLENALKTKPDLIKKKSELMEDELKIYQFEKDLATDAIEKILFATQNKAIDSFEKDRLLLKYKDQLKKLNGKMEKIQSEIDVTKLINLRNDLAFLIDNKISDIDEKIKEINFKIGTNYNIKEILNSTTRNKSYDDRKKNNPSSFIDREGSSGGEEDNINYRELTTYKNNPTQKRKEMIIESERKKIDDLKDQVLVALKRLDKTTGDIKIEEEGGGGEEQGEDLDTIKLTETNTILDKNPYDKAQNKQEEINEKAEREKEEMYSNIENEKKSSTNIEVENNANFPTIFSPQQENFQQDTVTTKGTFDPSSKKNSKEESLENNVNANPTTINESSNSFKYQDTNEKNNYNYNKKTPLSNILNQVSPNFNISMISKQDTNNLSKKEQSPQGNPTTLDHRHYNNNNNKKTNITRFKFPLAFIFSKKRKENEEGEHKKVVENSNFEAYEESKDPLKNIVNKKSERK